MMAPHPESQNASPTPMALTAEPAAEGPRRIRYFLAPLILIFAFVWTTHYLSPVRLPGDSRFALQISDSFLEGKWGDLDSYTIVHQINREHAREVNGRLLSWLPIGPSLLAMPAVALFKVVVPDFDEKVDTSNLANEQALIASFLVACASVILALAIHMTVKSYYITLAVTLAFAFGTSAWSTASRALWQHTPLLVITSALILLLLASQRRPDLVRYAGPLVALGVMQRPIAAALAAVITGLVALRYRKQLWWYLALAAATAAPWVLYNVVFHGGLLPSNYSADRLALGGRLFVGIAGSIVSPARGLFVFSPFLLFGIYGFWIAWRHHERYGLAREISLALGAWVAVHILVVSSYWDWYGGWSIGPRYMTDILPVGLVYVGISAHWLVAKRRHSLITLLALLVAVSVFIHARGATDPRVQAWNAQPVSVNEDQSRLWDWGDLQFLRGLPRPQPVRVAACPGQPIVDSIGDRIEDPGFECGVPRSASIAIDSGGTWTISSSLPRSGGFALAYATNGQASNGQFLPTGGSIANNLQVGPGEELNFALYARTTAPLGEGRNIALVIDWRARDGSIFAASSSEFAVVTGTYQRYEVSGVAPAETTYAYATFRIMVDMAGAPTQIVYFDDLYAGR